jgi:hypothetical protein
MINNLSPGFLPNGQIDTANIASGSKVPPSGLLFIPCGLVPGGSGGAEQPGPMRAEVEGEDPAHIDVLMHRRRKVPQ